MHDELPWTPGIASGGDPFGPPRSSDLRTMKINHRVLGMNHCQASFFHQAQSSDDQNETLCCSTCVPYACGWREQM